MMKILFLTRFDPKDINIWSGTLYHMYYQLIKKYRVEIIGIEVLHQLTFYSKINFHKDYFVSTNQYIKILGRLLSERINILNFDLLFFGDIFFIPLDIQIPFVHYSDLTFEQAQTYISKPDRRNIEPSMRLEKLMLNNSAKIIYTSEWIKQKAMEVYNIVSQKIEVVELGANIPTPTNYTIDIDMNVCRLVFIGKNWEKKGGDKVLQTYRILKSEGFPCSLTIIGSTPKEILDTDDDLTIIPFLNKERKEHLNKLCNVLSEAHFLVLPTVFDAYGIVFCEASAYGVPSIASNVGGVGQPVREGKNGFLLPSDATAQGYAEKIKSIFNDRENYIRLRASSRHEFETRLNWDVWGERVNTILEDTIKEWKWQRRKICKNK